MSVSRGNGEACRPVTLADRLAAFGDGPGLAAGAAAYVHDRSSQRLCFRRDGVAAWAREETFRLVRIEWPFFHDVSTMPQPRPLDNERVHENVRFLRLGTFMLAGRMERNERDYKKRRSAKALRLHRHDNAERARE